MSPAFSWQNTLQDHFARTKSLLVAALVVTGVMLGCSSNAAQKAQANGPGAMPVKVLVARAIPINDATRLRGDVEVARLGGELCPRWRGRSRKIYVHSGERVGAGTPLMEIDPLKQQATVKSQESSRAAQEANLSWARQQYTRAQGLYSAGVISRQDMDQAKTALGRGSGTGGVPGCAGARTRGSVALYKVEAPGAESWEMFRCTVGDRVTNSTVLTDGRQAGRSGSVRLRPRLNIRRSSR